MLEKLANLKEKVCNKGHCTCFPDTIFGKYIGKQCMFHDRRYANKRLTRLQADKLLFRAVKRETNVVIAGIMFLGVRAGGWYFYDKANDPKPEDFIEDPES